ncbi:MAG: hypothetical protein ACR65T_13320 [Methylocystis sp.]|uniref:hypothetical protein n=1 Tax=Methylocystis sp. TaxID=1911079 RepID=UPI003DA5594C
MGENAARPITVNREELFRQVWETPLIQLGETYGITGSGLAKICDRLAIPYPSRGHWAKKAAGKQVSRPSLPPPKPGNPSSATIKPTMPKPPLVLSAEQTALVDKAVRDGPISVPERLARPHPVIAGWIAEHDRQRRDAKRERDIFGPIFTEWTDTDHRRHRILDALFKAAARQGLRAETGERGKTYFTSGRDKIEFKLREKQKQVRRPKTEGEMRWSLPGDRNWTQVLEPTGVLVFKIDSYLGDSAIRNEWIEAPDAPLEKQLQEIVCSVILAASALAKLRNEREEAERRRLESEHRRQIERERRQREHNQWRRFIDLAHRWEEAMTAQRFLEELKAHEPHLTQTVCGRSIAEWFDWAQDQIRNRNPMNGGVEGIFKDVDG